jgi:hypothetical protein
MAAPILLIHMSLRNTLIKSRCAAVTVLLLTAWAIINLFHALQGPVHHLLVFIGTAIAIQDVPVPPPPVEIRGALLVSTEFLVSGLTEFGIAWFVAKTFYGAGPFIALRKVRKELYGGPHD